MQESVAEENPRLRELKDAIVSPTGFSDVSCRRRESQIKGIERSVKLRFGSGHGTSRRRESQIKGIESKDGIQWLCK